MEEYKKRMPLLLGLGISFILGMFFLHNNKALTEVIHILILSGVGFYCIGIYVRNSFSEAHLNYLDKKNSEIYLINKEGNNENVENNDIKVVETKKGKSSFDVSVEGHDDDFVELAKELSKEKN